MSPLAPYAITLQSSDETRAMLVGTLGGEVVSDDELRAECPWLGRTLVMLRRMDHIMSRTADARDRRGALLAELAEWYWNEEMSVLVGSDPGGSPSPGGSHRAEKSLGRSIGPPRPIIDANTIWSVPE
ncbi:MAG: hypothetical protein MPN21_05180 [Thermoanaerobaculia bacterium]|nr:hypothetical protein [Thermoanaerobaculia bacterium]